jgi:beta-carotene 3-hydroxylase
MIDLTNYLSFPIAIIIYFGVMILTTISMEGIAWLLHKFVMHGFGWYLHEDHHRYTEGRFEKNDSFAAIFAILSALSIIFGARELNILFWVGVGITLYGVGYFLFHDVIFHKRLKTKYKPKSNYMKRIFKAHSYHHQTTNAKGSGYSFGFLYAPKKYRTL